MGSQSLVDVIEWIWTLVAALGVAVSLWSLVDGYLDRRALRGNGEAATMIVRMNLRGAEASLLLHAFFLALGMLALATVNPPISVNYVIFASCYIVIAATNVRAVGLNQLERVRLRQRSR
jgi:hypothetical protein